MAMTKCKECKKEVSSSAKTCPHCGIKDPGVTAKQTLSGFFVLLALGTGLYFYFGGDDSTAKESQSAEAKQCSSDDSECLFSKYWPEVAPKCRKLVENASKFEHEWTDGMLTPMFSHFRNAAPTKQMTFIGDKVKFTNGFNAKTTMTYSCTYDLKKKSIVGFDIKSGKI